MVRCGVNKVLSTMSKYAGTFLRATAMTRMYSQVISDPKFLCTGREKKPVEPSSTSPSFPGPLPGFCGLNNCTLNFCFNYGRSSCRIVLLIFPVHSGPLCCSLYSCVHYIPFQITIEYRSDKHTELSFDVTCCTLNT